MVNYLLPLVVNDRRIHVTELNPTLASKPECFIMEVPNLNSFQVVSMNMQDWIRCLIPQGYDIRLSACTITATLSDHLLDIEVSERKQPTLVNSVTDTKDFEEIEEDDLADIPMNSAPETDIHVHVIGQLDAYLQLEVHQSSQKFTLTCRVIDAAQRASFTSSTLNIQFTLQTEKGSFIQQLETHLVHPSAYLGLALDFGSEASQLAVKRYTSFNNLPYRQEIETVKLFENVYNYHVSKQYIEREQELRYLQKEKDSNFFKSVFFIRKTLEGFKQDYITQPFICNEQRNFKMLVKEGVVGLNDDYHQLPNLKIIHNYDDALRHIHFDMIIDEYPIDISLKEIKSKTYATILKTFFASILKKEFIKYQESKFLSITLLVPNIYDAYDIRMTKQQINEIFVELSTYEFVGKIKAWEVITLSESDASFIGYLNKNEHQVQRDKDYIIIDCGKGTTDFSIIRSGASNIFDLKPVYRNGFAGAGNLITYAIFETVLHYLREHAEDAVAAKHFIKEKINKTLLGHDLKMRNSFYAEIERLKFNFVGDSKDVRQEWASAQSGDINLANITSKGAYMESMIDLLQQIDHISDMYGYVEAACDLIVHNIVDNIKIIQRNKIDFDCGGVLLSGRSFLFTRLRDKLQQSLQVELGIPAAQIVTLKSDELKEICIRGIFRDAVHIHPELIGYPIQIISRKADTATTATTEVVEKNRTKLFSTILKRLLGDQSDGYIPEVVFNEEGKLDYAKMSHSTLLIGNKTYAVRGNDFYSVAQGIPVKADIQFTPDGYFVRRKNKAGLLENISEIQQIGDLEDASRELLIPSLFPAALDEKMLWSLQRSDIVLTSATPIPATVNVEKETTTSLPEQAPIIVQETPSKNDLYF